MRFQETFNKKFEQAHGRYCRWCERRRPVEEFRTNRSPAKCRACEAKYSRPKVL